MIVGRLPAIKVAKNRCKLTQKRRINKQIRRCFALKISICPVLPHGPHVNLRLTSHEPPDNNPLNYREVSELMAGGKCVDEKG